MTRATMQVELAERRVILSRDFDFPRELVFRAWTESAALTRWWGPHGFDTEVVENDLRVGGAYHFIMR
ncbi:MAG: SRPBCC domain-containing protein, partial [Rhodanobacteraceae bacterium]|nr:SRPBCC domain-containing protein [Rhodanobacteraceae bacterium]